jgi:hypothetical protein
VVPHYASLCAHSCDTLQNVCLRVRGCVFVCASAVLFPFDRWALPSSARGAETHTPQPRASRGKRKEEERGRADVQREACGWSRFRVESAADRRPHCALRGPRRRPSVFFPLLRPVRGEGRREEGRGERCWWRVEDGPLSLMLACAHLLALLLFFQRLPLDRHAAPFRHHWEWEHERDGRGATAHARRRR